jgi:hypothetical protein
MGSAVERRQSCTVSRWLEMATAAAGALGQARETAIDRLPRDAPDLRGGLLDPAGPGIGDRRRHGVLRLDPRTPIKRKRFGVGRPLINRENVAVHRPRAPIASRAAVAIPAAVNP